ncbi:MAG TPA: hypothetical protein VE487_06080 [Ilumatobacter sp.]|jgi:hypothetical protein|nr:hypothetical protein [Ilumatobacter sp.]
MSGVADVWDTLAAEVDGRAWQPELARWVEVKRFEARGGRVYAMVANRRDLVYYRLEASEIDLLQQLDPLARWVRSSSPSSSCPANSMPR